MYITFSWREYGSEAGGYRVGVNDTFAGSGTLNRSLMPDPEGPALVVAGKEIGDQGRLTPSNGLEVENVYVFKNSFGRNQIELISEENLKKTP
jgi:hypothetical protein